MKYSMMSYTMTRQSKLFDLDRMFELTAELELDGIDIVNMLKHDMKELRMRADDIGVPVVCHTFGMDLNSPDAAVRRAEHDNFKRGMDRAAVLGAPCIMVTTPAKTGLSHAESRRNWIAGLQEVGPIAEEYGIVLTVENFPGAESPFVIADEVLEAVKAVPGMKITFDSGNAASGEDPAESFARCAGHVVHAHFKDWDISAEPAEGYRMMRDGRYYRSALIGEGNLDHRACLQAMKDAGYDGCINIEYEGNKYDPYTGTRRAVEYLRSIEPG